MSSCRRTLKIYTLLKKIVLLSVPNIKMQERPTEEEKPARRETNKP